MQMLQTCVSLKAHVLGFLFSLPAQPQSSLSKGNLIALPRKSNRLQPRDAPSENENCSAVACGARASRPGKGGGLPREAPWEARPGPAGVPRPAPRASPGASAPAARSLPSALSTSGPAWAPASDSDAAPRTLLPTAPSESSRPAPACRLVVHFPFALSAARDGVVSAFWHVRLFVLPDSGLHATGCSVSVFSFTGAPRASIRIRHKNERQPKPAGEVNEQGGVQGRRPARGRVGGSTVRPTGNRRGCDDALCC